MSGLLTERVLRERLDAGEWRIGKLIKLFRRGEINRLTPMLALPLGPYAITWLAAGEERAAAISHCSGPISTGSMVSIPSSRDGGGRIRT